MTICCSIRGTAVEALHDHTAEACIMSEFLMNTFLGSMPLVPTDKLFRSPSGLFFECRGIVRGIVDFELLIGCPLCFFVKNHRKGASTMIPGKLLSPLLSLARQFQWWNIIFTITHKKR